MGVKTLPRPLARTRFMTRSGTEAVVEFMWQKIDCLFLTIKRRDLRRGRRTRELKAQLCRVRGHDEAGVALQARRASAAPRVFMDGAG